MNVQCYKENYKHEINFQQVAIEQLILIYKSNLGSTTYYMQTLTHKSLQI